jgi:hypothetical protein
VRSEVLDKLLELEVEEEVRVSVEDLRGREEDKDHNEGSDGGHGK